MISAFGAGPYTGAGTIYTFGNTPLNVPAQFVVQGNGGDVIGAGNWITSLGGIAGDFGTFTTKIRAKGYTSDSAIAAAGYKIGKFGWLWVLLPLNNLQGSDALYSYIQQLMSAQGPPGGSPPGGSPPGGSPPGGSPPGGSPPGGSPPGGSPPAKAGNWLTESTIAGIPNWVLVLAGGGIIFTRVKRKSAA